MILFLQSIKIHTDILMQAKNTVLDYKPTVTNYFQSSPKTKCRCKYSSELLQVLRLKVVDV